MSETDEKVYYSRVMTQEDISHAESWWGDPWVICEAETDRIVAMCPTLDDTTRIVSLLISYGHTVRLIHKEM